MGSTMMTAEELKEKDLSEASKDISSTFSNLVHLLVSLVVHTDLSLNIFDHSECESHCNIINGALQRWQLILVLIADDCSPIDGCLENSIPEICNGILFVSKQIKINAQEADLSGDQKWTHAVNRLCLLSMVVTDLLDVVGKSALRSHMLPTRSLLNPIAELAYEVCLTDKLSTIYSSPDNCPPHWKLVGCLLFWLSVLALLPFRIQDENLNRLENLSLHFMQHQARVAKSGADLFVSLASRPLIFNKLKSPIDAVTSTSDSKESKLTPLGTSSMWARIKEIIKFDPSLYPLVCQPLVKQEVFSTEDLIQLSKDLLEVYSNDEFVNQLNLVARKRLISTLLMICHLLNEKSENTPNTRPMVQFCIKYGFGHESVAVRWTTSKGLARLQSSFEFVPLLINSATSSSARLGRLESAMAFYASETIRLQKLLIERICITITSKQEISPEMQIDIQNFKALLLNQLNVLRTCLSSKERKDAALRDAVCLFFIRLAQTVPCGYSPFDWRLIMEPLLCISVLDNQLLCRRAAQAAIQEIIGRGLVKDNSKATDLIMDDSVCDSVSLSQTIPSLSSNVVSAFTQRVHSMMKHSPFAFRSLFSAIVKTQHFRASSTDSTWPSVLSMLTKFGTNNLSGHDVWLSTETCDKAVRFLSKEGLNTDSNIRYLNSVALGTLKCISAIVLGCQDLIESKSLEEIINSVFDNFGSLNVLCPKMSRPSASCSTINKAECVFRFLMVLMNGKYDLNYKNRLIHLWKNIHERHNCRKSRMLAMEMLIRVPEPFLEEDYWLLDIEDPIKSATANKSKERQAKDNATKDKPVLSFVSSFRSTLFSFKYISGLPAVRAAEESASRLFPILLFMERFAWPLQKNVSSENDTSLVIDFNKSRPGSPDVSASDLRVVESLLRNLCSLMRSMLSASQLVGQNVLILELSLFGISRCLNCSDEIINENEIKECLKELIKLIIGCLFHPVELLRIKTLACLLWLDSSKAKFFKAEYIFFRFAFNISWESLLQIEDSGLENKMNFDFLDQIKCVTEVIRSHITPPPSEFSSNSSFITKRSYEDLVILTFSEIARCDMRTTSTSGDNLLNWPVLLSDLISKAIKRYPDLHAAVLSRSFGTSSTEFSRFMRAVVDNCLCSLSVQKINESSNLIINLLMENISIIKEFVRLPVTELQNKIEASCPDWMVVGSWMLLDHLTTNFLTRENILVSGNSLTQSLKDVCELASSLVKHENISLKMFESIMKFLFNLSFKFMEFNSDGTKCFDSIFVLNELKSLNEVEERSQKMETPTSLEIHRNFIFKLLEISTINPVCSRITTTLALNKVLTFSPTE